MRRRDLLALVAGVAALCPLAGLTQQPKVTTIGVLALQAPGTERFWRLFRDDLLDLGYIEGQNVRFEFRQGEVIRLPELAAELVRLNVDLIAAWQTPAVLAAKQATREIPIVMAGAANPVEVGLVASLARPGGNVTGVGGFGAEAAGKCVELTREMLPSARRIAVLANAPDPFSKLFLEQIRLSGEATGTMIEPFMIHTPEELDAAFPEMNKEQADAVIVQPSLPPKRGAELALKYGIPAVSIVRAIVDEGGLMSYGVAGDDVNRRAAALVDKVLKGAKPAELPVERPVKFELVVNLKTAKALGLTIPPSFLARADEVIE
jgi:putative ABC transport system substrate-binding protein